MKHEDTEAWQGRGERRDRFTLVDVVLAVLLVTCIVCAAKGWFPAGV